MVALTKKRSWAQYGWFCHGRSQIEKFIILLIFMSIMTSYNNAFSYNIVLLSCPHVYVIIIMTLYPIPEKENKNST